MQIINYPLAGYHKDDYFQLYEKVVAALKNNSDIKCICTFGGVNQPGISDIDLLITIKQGATFKGDIISELTSKEKVLFTHGVMALSEQHWFQNKAYALWDNQQLLSGEAPSGDEIVINETEINALKKQTALEFLFTNYIDLTLQKEYNLIKLRDLLQHTKGITYDLNYLNLSNTPIDSFVLQAKDWITNWHLSQPKEKEIKLWFKQFYLSYEELICQLFKQHSIYLHDHLNLNFSKNIKLQNQPSISYIRNGNNLPGFMMLLMQKKAVKLLNKTNSFVFNVPLTNNAENSILEKRLQFFREMKTYNQKHFPNLGLLTTSLMSKIV